MAVEDAYILSNLLAKCTSASDLGAAFDAYDFVRVPRALRVSSQSRYHGTVLDLEGDEIGDDLEKLAEWLKTSVKWIWNEDLEGHLALALQKFEAEAVRP